MISHDEIKTALQAAIPLDEVYVHSDDGNHFTVIAVSDCFAPLSRVKKQQIIYEPLAKYIADNRIHALSIQTYTQDEWRQKRLLMNL